MTVDGFGFGTLTGESCLKNVHCHTDRASWGAILVTVVAFGALMWEKCAQSHSFGLGRVGGGGYHWGGGGSANREPGSYLHNPGFEVCLFVFQTCSFSQIVIVGIRVLGICLSFWLWHRRNDKPETSHFLLTFLPCGCYLGKDRTQQQLNPT